MALNSFKAKTSAYKHFSSNMTLKCCFLVLYKIRCFHVFLFPIGILKVFSRCEKTMFGSPPFLSVAQPGLRQVSWFLGTTVGSTDILIFQNVIPKSLSTGNGLEYRAQPGLRNSQICQFGGEGDSHNNVWNYLLKMNMQASCGIL